MEKAQIDQRVANILSIEPEKIARALYRDLDELVNAGEVQDFRFTAGGEPIEGYDPEIHKNTTCQWALVSETRDVLGSGPLLDAGCQIYVTDSLQDDVVVTVNPGIEGTQRLRFIFSHNAKLFCIAVNRDALPLMLIVGRREIGRSAQSAPPIANSRRLIDLRIPRPGLSAYKSEEQPGHFSVSVDKNGDCKIEDYGSKNGTTFAELNSHEAEELLSNIANIQNKTVTRSWGSLAEGERSLSPVKRETEVALPFWIQASESFRMMVN